MTEDKKSDFAIIPADVRYDENLTPNAKLLYGEITALCNEKGYCWASNAYFAKLYKVSNTSVSLWIKQLKDNGYIEIEQHYKPGTKEILNRYLSILKGGIQEILNTPPQEILKENNTYINNTINNTKKEKPTIPPSYSDVAEYIRQNSFPILAAEFIDCYEMRGWMVGNHKMKDWKAAVRTYVRNEIKWNKNKQQNKPVKKSLTELSKENERMCDEV